MSESRKKGRDTRLLRDPYNRNQRGERTNSQLTQCKSNVLEHVRDYAEILFVVDVEHRVWEHFLAAPHHCRDVGCELSSSLEGVDELGRRLEAVVVGHDV